jgi:thioesterase domain-containing protein
LQIVCAPPVLAAATSSPYGRLAPHFQGRHELWTMRLPGIREEEPLPGSLADVIDTWAAALPTDPARALFLLGHSSGGLLAHGLASALQQRGTPVGGLILLDTAHLASAAETEPMDELVDELMGKLAEASSLATPAMLTAARTYERLLQDWALPPLDAPTLFIHPHSSRLHQIWPQPRAARAVPGTHLSIVGEHAPDTAHAIHDWLDQPATGPQHAQA